MIYTLITGASKGIGKAFAQACAQKKMNLILVARSKPELDQLAASLQEAHQIKVITYSGDLVRPQTPQEIANWCVRHKYSVNMLINNAGCGHWGAFETLPAAKQLDSIQLNVNSLTAMTHAFLPLLRKQAKGYVLNVASVAGFMPMPYFAVYAATKAYVVSFSRALHQELRKDGIKVSCLCPGPTASDFFGNAGMEGFKWNKDKLLMPAEDVAQLALKETLKGKEVIIPGVSNKFGKLLSDAFPSKLIAKVMGYVYKP